MIGLVHQLFACAAIAVSSTLSLPSLPRLMCRCCCWPLLQVTLLGLWMMPALFSLQLKFYRFVAVSIGWGRWRSWLFIIREWGWAICWPLAGEHGQVR